MATPRVFAGSFLNDEYILSRNVLHLEKQPGIFLTLNLVRKLICKQRTIARRKERKKKNQNRNIKLTGGVTSKAHKRRAWDQLTRSRRGSGISWRIWDGSPLGLVSSCPLFTTKKTRFYLEKKNQLLRSSTVVYSCNPRIWETKERGRNSERSRLAWSIQ